MGGDMNEQSDAEPKGIDLYDVDRDAFRAGVEFGLRHTAPPRPDASGLIEAAEWLTEHAKKLRGRIGADNLSHLVANEIDYSAAYLRSRAADRSGK